jgi:hypothetical protein
VDERSIWIEKVKKLVAEVEPWVKELGWQTRRINKRLDDSEIGRHRVPALLMQEGTTQVLLEPVGRSASGIEGVVDLYILPAYDDIATLYFYDGGWNIHYYFEATPVAGAVREAPGIPLTKDALKRVLDKMQADAV